MSSAIAKHPVAERRDRAFGATRFSSGEPGTDYRYTGQREMSEIGLYYRRAGGIAERSGAPRSDRRERSG